MELSQKGNVDWFFVAWALAQQIGRFEVIISILQKIDIYEETLISALPEKHLTLVSVSSEIANLRHSRVDALLNGAQTSGMISLFSTDNAG